MTLETLSPLLPRFVYAILGLSSVPLVVAIVEYNLSVSRRYGALLVTQGDEMGSCLVRRDDCDME
jgi:hypothetical protein